MPRIFDNIEQQLLPALRQALDSARRADFCVGYFNLRGWKQLDDAVERWAGGDGQCCRLLVGMQRLPQEDLRDALRIGPADDEMYLQKAAALRRRLAEKFREQLTMGAPIDIGKGGGESRRQSVFATPDPFFPFPGSALARLAQRQGRGVPHEKWTRS
jgi:hypothetical protein